MLALPTQGLADSHAPFYVMTRNSLPIVGQLRALSAWQSRVL